MIILFSELPFGEQAEVVCKWKNWILGAKRDFGQAELSALSLWAQAGGEGLQGAELRTHPESPWKKVSETPLT